VKYKSYVHLAGRGNILAYRVLVLSLSENIDRDDFEVGVMIKLKKELPK
jgi:hypothetical protein